MNASLSTAFAAGYAALVAQTALVDAINVFPVKDGDTGANLRVSLAPLAQTFLGDTATRVTALLRTACGNSGNIAAAFFSEFIQAQTPSELPDRAAAGAARALRAVAEPKPGTMLDIFAMLSALLRKYPVDDAVSPASCPALFADLAAEVRRGPTLLPQLRAAGVVDAGALAMYIFFAGFFRHLTGDVSVEIPLGAVFPGLLTVADTYQAEQESGFCVDVLLETGGVLPEPETLDGLGDSLVALPEQNHLKLHVHTNAPAELRERLSEMGRIVSWTDSPLNSSLSNSLNSSLNGQPGGLPHGRPDSPFPSPAVRVITDAAGSLPGELAAKEGIILFDSLIAIAGQALPEGEVNPAELYRRMRLGEKAGTAQAARFERENQLAKCCQAGHSLYLTVGSAYTGNYQMALDWQRDNPAGAALTVVDSGAASGRLALMAMLTARYAARGGTVANVAEYAGRLGLLCEEFLFIDRLAFLAAGGRVSRAGEFFTGVFGLKPVISPLPDGVRKLGLVRGRSGQLAFLMERLGQRPAEEKALGPALVLLQYTDNREWLAATLPDLIRSFYPQTEIHIVPLSLTTGAHVGPGSWSVALGWSPAV
jgi:DegV family protein with EDD domain